MSYNGSGTFQINTSGQPVVAGTVISATAFNALTADLATGLSTAITKDGQTTTTARIPFAAGISSTLTTDSSSVSTGSIITAGGIGAAKAAYIGTTLNVGGASTFTGSIAVDSVTDSSSTTTGSIQTDGGVGIAKALFVGTTANIAGVTTVQAGTASLPAITTTGDTNTGIFFPAADTIAFSEGGTEAMRLDSAGNMGLGVTPSAWASRTVLEVGAAGNAFVSGGAGDVYVTEGCYYNAGWKYGNSLYATALYNQYRGTHSWSTAASGTAGNTVSFNQAMTLDASGHLLVAKTTTNDGDTGFMFEPIRDGAGNGRLTITQSSSTNSGVSYSAYSSGAAAYRFYVGMGGTIFATSTTISAISDIRYKENVRDLNVGLAEVMALKPRLYDWKEGKGADIKNARGFIAQEFEEVFPDLIDEWKDPAPEGEDPYKSVRADLIPVLVKAIQEQQAIIQTLTDRITALEAK
jgi:hypothetical protein